MEIVRGRKISPGKTEGLVLVSQDPISFFGGVDPETGIVTEKGHKIEGFTIKNKVLVFPHGKGSTVGSYALYRMKKGDVSPKAIVNIECEPIVAVGAIISNIPTIDRLAKNPLSILRNGMRVRVDADHAQLELLD